MNTILVKWNDGKAIAGESTIDGHIGETTALSYSHGVAQQITGDPTNTKRTGGRPNMQDFTISKYLDRGTPGLNQYCCEAKELPVVTITVLQNDSAAQIKLMVYTLKNVLISSVSVGGGGDIPMETVTLNYSHITWDYTAQKKEGKAEGVVPAVWDLALNKAA